MIKVNYTAVCFKQYQAKQFLKQVCLINKVRVMDNNSFYVQAYYNGGLTGFEIIPRDDDFLVANNGDIIAILHHGENWQQVSGKRLPDDVLQSLYQQIEKPKSQA